MKKIAWRKLTVATLIMSACSAFITSAYAETKIVTAENVEWGYLNPARGDKSPGAADLWGDRTKDTATGMLVRFNKGFESPPHIHNITYRGIVIKGEMHNDDPSAAKMWMPTGSFWTQPAGEDHTTAANDKTNLIYLEIDEGPYLVKSSKEHFDNGERPVNLHIDNMVWLQKSDLVNIGADGVSATYLWGDTNSVYGTLIKLPSGFEGSISSKGGEFKAVVVKGSLNYKQDSSAGALTLNAGSYIETSTTATHEVRNVSDADAIVYVRSSSKYQVKN
ncbi:DUF4437 domain-containing protein [Alteromonas sp. ALT199]|uniref:DUF4437 domain-containing protein n=1 Tax=unclassified Alteromonas TaxID=2614992 RepID=UPI001BEC41C5|nr:DUF4437 domain-containing protein [Alteromonas sp. ALT199]MBT3133761.1 DUF4437 domain-containing protein [Alteromonas sp. ALT199]